MSPTSLSPNCLPIGSLEFSFCQVQFKSEYRFYTTIKKLFKIKFVPTNFIVLNQGSREEDLDETPAFSTVYCNLL